MTTLYVRSWLFRHNQWNDNITSTSVTTSFKSIIFDSPKRKRYLASSSSNEKIDTNNSTIKTISSKLNTSETNNIIGHVYFNKSSVPYTYQKGPLDNTYISRERALTDFLLSNEDIKTLKRYRMRSAYGSAQTSVSDYFAKSDLLQKVVDKYGSLENVTKANSQFDFDEQRIDQIHVDLMKAMNYIRNLNRSSSFNPLDKKISIKLKNKMLDDTFLIKISLIGNVMVLATKIIAWRVTKSNAILAEVIHSLLDIFTQLLRYIGVLISLQKPSKKHPYGYSRALYAFSLCSGICVFFCGCLFPIYNSFQTLFEPNTLHNMHYGLLLMGLSSIFELITLGMSFISIKRQANKNNTTFLKYIRNSSDPTATALFLEDSVAIIGLGVAYISLLLCDLFYSPIPDAIGGMTIGSIMGLVSLFQIRNNYEILVGQSIPHETISKILEILENDKLILSVNDYKATYYGKEKVRFKAEITINGRELTKLYLHNVNMPLMLQDVTKIKNEKQLNDFMVLNGEQITDLIGSEVDRIENNIKEQFPEIRHIDLEIS